MKFNLPRNSKQTRLFPVLFRCSRLSPLFHQQSPRVRHNTRPLSTLAAFR